MKYLGNKANEKKYIIKFLNYHNLQTILMRKTAFFLLLYFVVMAVSAKVHFAAVVNYRSETTYLSVTDTMIIF